MFGLMKKKMLPNTLAAVCPNRDGVALAQIRRDADVPPMLEFCEYQALEANQDDNHALEKLVKEAELDRSLCISLVELGDYSLLMVEAPQVQADEMVAAVRWRIKDLIDFDVADAAIDVFELPETKAGSDKTMVYAVVARATEVKNRIDKLLGAGLQLDIIDIPELALRNIAALLPEDVGGVVLVYIGRDKGLITITRHSTLYLSRRIESGLSSLPDGAMHQGDPEVVEDWLDRIVIEIQRSMDYYESHFSQAQVSGLVLTPTPYELPGASEYLSSQLGIPARQLNVNELIDLPEQLSSETQANCILAIGAALREKGEVQ